MAQPPALWAILLAAAATGYGAPADPPLVSAARSRDHTALKNLLKQGEVNSAQNDGATALHWAAHLDDLDAVDMLVQAGSNVNATNVYGATPLSLACLNGNPLVVGRLLEAGANPNQSLPSGETPLMTSARTGNIDAVKELLKAGARVNVAENIKGQTPLMWAAAEGHGDIVGLLIEFGANVKARSKADFTPLLFAARSGDIESAKALLEAGADLKETAPDGTDPLILAAASGNEDLGKFLLERGANPNTADIYGFTPLHAATWRQVGRVELVRALLARGADPNRRLKRAPPRISTELVVPGAWRGLGYEYLIGATPFLLAAAGADVEVMRVLAGKGANVADVTDDGTTALMLASGFGWTVAINDGIHAVELDPALQAVKVAVGLGLDVNAVNHAGQSALHGAAVNGADEIVKFLIDKGAEVNIWDKTGRTALYFARHAQLGASIIEHKTTTALLVKYGAKE